MNDVLEAGVIGKECKHAIYVRAQDGSKDDLIAIKETVHLENGETRPSMNFIENYERDFYVTKHAHRTHDQKTEWEQMNKLQRFKTTQNKMPEAVARALGNPGFKASLPILARSPYLYGTDVSGSVIVKNSYRERWPDCNSESTVAVLDTETDVIEGHEEIISISITYKNKAVLLATKHFLRNTNTPEASFHKALDLYLGSGKKNENMGDLINARNLSVEFGLVDNAGEAVKLAIEKAHQWMPDFLAIWNMNFDVPKMMTVLERYGYNPADVFSDPKVPPKYRYAYYREGPSNKITASGKYMTLHPAERWHTLTCPSSFYVIDAMCVYLRVRIVKGKEASYALDYILGKDLNLGKLRFKEAEEYTGLQWHRYMQKNHPMEYLVYNLFDCIGVEMLDEKNKDLALTLTTLIESSDYARFPSQPRRTCDDLHFYLLKRNMVIASTSDSMEEELDEHVWSTSDWVVTLPTHLVDDNGIALTEELPDVKSKYRAHVLD